jgi:hypothetical protein
VGRKTIVVKQHGHKAPFRRYQPTASKSTYSAVTGEQGELQWRPSAADRLVGLEGLLRRRVVVRGAVRACLRKRPDLRMVRLPEEIAGCKASEDSQNPA